MKTLFAFMMIGYLVRCVLVFIKLKDLESKGYGLYTFIELTTCMMPGVGLIIVWNLNEASK